jgi:hypothetical protein
MIKKFSIKSLTTLKRNYVYKLLYEEIHWEDMMQSNRKIAVIWGFIYIIGAIAIYVNYSGWWTHIVGGLLIGLAWMAFTNKV